MSFENLKRNSESNFQKLLQTFDKATGKQERQKDERFWYPVRDKAGNGYGVIRFLPTPEGEEDPFIRIWEHGFKGPTGAWYIEKSLTTLGQDDPVSTYNTKLWNTGLDSDKQIARAQKRKLTFITNILVVEDPQNPENEGKVFLFRFGKKIFDKLFSASNPEYPDEKPFDPTNLWTSANFKLKIRKVDGQTNYEKSEFEDVGPVAGDEKRIEEIYRSEYSLKEFIDPKTFKTYDELERRLNFVLGLDKPKNNSKVEVVTTNEEEESPPWDEEKTELPTEYETTEEADFLNSILNDK